MRPFAPVSMAMLLVLVVAEPATARCVGANGQSRSGVAENHTIKPGVTDKGRFVRLTKGEATVQVDVTRSYNARGSCSASNDRLSFGLHWTKASAAQSCLSPSRRGPASFLSCYFKAQKLGPDGRTGKWFVHVRNPGRCTVAYKLICRDGKHTP